MTEQFSEPPLDYLFHPRSIALAGASRNPTKRGNELIHGLQEAGYKGAIYPINPGATEINGLRAYPRVSAVPYQVDYVISVLPIDGVKALVEDCAAKGVKILQLYTAGFSESGSAEGKQLEDEIVAIAKRAGMRLIGPNCVGIYCPSSKLPFPLRAGQEPGSVGLVSQSGFFADFFTQTATGNTIKFSKAISCGNESDLSTIDFLEYLGEDPETSIIVAYLEGIKDGRRFYQLSKEISKKKPIILWKGGLTEAGARAAVSHTGSLAGTRSVWEGALKQAGIVSVKSFEEALDCLYAFYLQPLPKGNRVGIVSGPGGTAVATTDMCLELGMEVPLFSPDVLMRLSKAIPPVGSSVNNPIDLSLASLVTPRVYRDAVRIVAEEADVDMLLVIAVTGGEELRDIISEALENIKTRKPLVLTVMAGTMQSVARDFPLFLESGISMYSDAARAAKTLARMWEYARFRAQWSTL